MSKQVKMTMTGVAVLFALSPIIYGVMLKVMLSSTVSNEDLFMSAYIGYSVIHVPLGLAACIASYLHGKGRF